MKTLPIREGALLIIWVASLFSLSFCHGNVEKVEVVGFGEYADCAESNIENSMALSGLGISIDCKLADTRPKLPAWPKLPPFPRSLPWFKPLPKE